MNLPASAITFLDAFIGLYQGQEELFEPHTENKLPLIHVYCFSSSPAAAKKNNKATSSSSSGSGGGSSDDDDVLVGEEEKEQICKEIGKVMEYDLIPHMDQVHLWHVRDVAPRKRMYCVTFRLPPQVAFRVRNEAVSWESS